MWVLVSSRGALRVIKRYLFRVYPRVWLSSVFCPIVFLLDMPMVVYSQCRGTNQWLPLDGTFTFRFF